MLLTADEELDLKLFPGTGAEVLGDMNQEIARKSQKGASFLPRFQADFLINSTKKY